MIPLKDAERAVEAAVRFDQQAAALVASWADLAAALTEIRNAGGVPRQHAAALRPDHYQKAVLSALRKLPGIETQAGTYAHTPVAEVVAAGLATMVTRETK